MQVWSRLLPGGDLKHTKNSWLLSFFPFGLLVVGSSLAATSCSRRSFACFRWHFGDNLQDAFMICTKFDDHKLKTSSNRGYHRVWPRLSRTIKQQQVLTGMENINCCFKNRWMSRKEAIVAVALGGTTFHLIHQVQ